MPRLKLEISGSYPFSTEIPVRVSDLNYGAHVGNDALLSILHEARLRYLRSMGYENELNISGAGLIMTDVAVTYRSEGFLGDVLKIEVGIADVTRVGFDFVYRVFNQTRDQEMALAKTAMAAFDVEKRKVQNLPEPFRRKIPASLTCEVRSNG
ncbi:MAG TPA: thioesterase family protein [Bdellovibrionota bacterium]|nr:thioesterase family protein [Bdellovibrionota bacterium]